ncbi:hypothetical protein TNCV_2235991 [Trichonephila clavipes]|nr:hypothetical protein TNCV_2235991 [Trichonephila clavipes]
MSLWWSPPKDRLPVRTTKRSCSFVWEGTQNVTILTVKLEGEATLDITSDNEVICVSPMAISGTKVPLTRRDINQWPNDNHGCVQTEKILHPMSLLNAWHIPPSKRHKRRNTRTYRL